METGNKLVQLRAELAAAEKNHRLETIKQSETKWRQSVVKTRELRDEDQKAVAEFTRLSHLWAQAEKVYGEAVNAIDELDESRDDYPTDEELEAYGTKRESLVAEMERRREAYLRAKNAVEVMRMQVVRADTTYVTQAQITQSLANQLERLREEDRVATSRETMLARTIKYAQ